MVKREINVYLEPKLAISIKKAWFISIIHKILDALGVKEISELGLVLTTSETIQQLNKTYRKKDEPTDVLAFYMFSQQDAGTKFAYPPNGIYHLGEIVISYPQAVYQAKEKRHNIERELTILIIHGVLHLLGYDHKRSSEEKRIMNAKEKEISKKLSSYQSKQ